MTRSLEDKFHKHIPLLEQTVRRECDLDHSNPKLYRKVYRYFKGQGVEFFGNPDDDYELIVEELQTALNKNK